VETAITALVVDSPAPDGRWAGKLLRTDNDGWIYEIYASFEDEIWVLGTITGSGVQPFTVLDLHLAGSSLGIDAADGDLAPPLDMHHRVRFDVPDIPNTGVGDPPYADIGCFELRP
jgi:hypothetical protein